MFDEGQPLLRRNSASSYLRNSPKGSMMVTSNVAASRVESSSFFSSSSIAKMLNNFDYTTPTPSKRQGRWKTRSTSTTSMRSRPQRRSSSGSGLSTTSSTDTSQNAGRFVEQMGPRASSSSSLGSFDDRYDHLYSYSSNLDLFEHQLYKASQRRVQQPSSKSEAVNDFDLTAETRLLMDRTNQLVGKKSDREWVI